MKKQLYFVLKPSNVRGHYYVDNIFDRQPYKQRDAINTQPAQIHYGATLNNSCANPLHKNEFTMPYARKPEFTSLIDHADLEQQNKNFIDQQEEMARKYIDEAAQYQQTVKEELRQLKYQIGVDKKYATVQTSTNETDPATISNSKNAQELLNIKQNQKQTNNEILTKFKEVIPNQQQAANNHQMSTQSNFITQQQVQNDNILFKNYQFKNNNQFDVQVNPNRILPTQTIKLNVLDDFNLERRCQEHIKFIEEIRKPKPRNEYIDQMAAKFREELMHQQFISEQSEKLSQKAHFATILQNQEAASQQDVEKQASAVQQLLERINELETLINKNPVPNTVKSQSNSLLNTSQRSQAGKKSQQDEQTEAELRKQLNQSRIDNEILLKSQLEQQKLQQQVMQQEYSLQQYQQKLQQQMQQQKQYELQIQQLQMSQQNQRYQMEMQRQTSSESTEISQEQVNIQQNTKPQYSSASRISKQDVSKSLSEELSPQVKMVPTQHGVIKIPTQVSPVREAASSDERKQSDSSKHEQIDLLKIGNIKAPIMVSRTSLSIEKSIIQENKQKQQVDPLMKQLMEAKTEKPPEKNQIIRRDSFDKSMKFQKAEVKQLEPLKDQSMLKSKRDPSPDIQKPPLNPKSRDKSSINISLNSSITKANESVIKKQEPSLLIELDDQQVEKNTVKEPSLIIDLDEEFKVASGKHVIKQEPSNPFSDGEDKVQDAQKTKKKKKAKKTVGPIAKVAANTSLNIEI